MLAPYRVECDGAYYWLSLEHGTPEEALRVIRESEGDDSDDHDIGVIAQMSEEDARKSVIRGTEPLTTIWDENATATRPCVLACSEE